MPVQQCNSAHEEHKASKQTCAQLVVHGYDLHFMKQGLGMYGVLCMCLRGSHGTAVERVSYHDVKAGSTGVESHTESRCWVQEALGMRL